MSGRQYTIANCPWRVKVGKVVRFHRCRIDSDASRLPPAPAPRSVYRTAVEALRPGRKGTCPAQRESEPVLRFPLRRIRTGERHGGAVPNSCFDRMMRRSARQASPLCIGWQRTAAMGAAQRIPAGPTIVLQDGRACSASEGILLASGRTRIPSPGVSTSLFRKTGRKNSGWKRHHRDSDQGIEPCQHLSWTTVRTIAPTRSGRE